MRTRWLYVLCYCLLSPLFLKAQGPLVLDVLGPQKTNLRTNDSNATLTFELDGVGLSRAYQAGLPDQIDWLLPINGPKTLVRMERRKFLGQQTTVFNSANRRVEVDFGYHYQYVHQDTLIALSIFEDGLSAQLSFGGENYSLGAADQYSEKYGLVKAKAAAPGGCSVSEELEASVIRKLEQLTLHQISTRNQLPPVDVYFELDHFLYKENNKDIGQSIVFFLGIFNGVQMLYAREGINLRLHSIKVWDGPDNYATANGSMALLSFREHLQDTQSNPSWDIAVLVSRFSNEDSSAPNGGLANIDGLCNSAKRQAYANINVSTDSFPDFSWSVFLISHEIGHTLGAPHSHNCSWPEGPLDNCYCPEGDCPDGPSVATTGGTIMSYCYLRRPFQSSCPEFPSGTNPGVNFLLGFGAYPRALMQQNILEAACLRDKSLADLPNLQSDTATTLVQVNDSLLIKGLKIWNNGSAEVDSFLVQFNPTHIGFRDTLKAPDLLLRLPGIGANDTLEIDTTLWWSSTADSNWTWIIDPQQIIREWHEGDNWIQQKLQENYQFPQLALSANDGLEDSTFFFKLNQFDLQNVGGDTAAPIQITYFLSSNRELDENDIEIGTNNNQFLAKREKVSFPVIFFKPDLIMPEGKYYLIAKAELVGTDIPLAYPNTWIIILEEGIELGPPKFKWFRN